MMCYALGALDIYDGIYDIEEVRMTIFQPPPRKYQFLGHQQSRPACMG